MTCAPTTSRTLPSGRLGVDSSTNQPTRRTGRRPLRIAPGGPGAGRTAARCCQLARNRQGDRLAQGGVPLQPKVSPAVVIAPRQ